MAKYVGEYAINEKLTKALNMDGWVIYRNPSIGLFVVNDELTQDIDLVCYSASSITNIDKFIEGVRGLIAEAEKQCGWKFDRGWKSLIK